MLSKYENSPSDKSLLDAYKKLNLKFKKHSFLSRGSDERQYNSPGVDLGITSIFRTKYGEYREYHSSLDDFNLVTEKGISGGFKVAKTAIEILLEKIIPKNKILCEPQMGKRNLYPSLSSKDKMDTTNNPKVDQTIFATRYTIAPGVLAYASYADFDYEGATDNSGSETNIGLRVNF